MILRRMTTDPKSHPYRLVVEDDGLLITIAEELLTSRNPGAQVTSIHGAIDLTKEEARWVHRALGEVLDGRPAGPDPEGEQS